MIEIKLNGEPQTCEASLTIASLIENLDLGERRIAVLRNGDVIARENQISTFLANGDMIEIVHMVGGG